MILETTNYFAKDGQLEDVIAQRMLASAIRRELNLSPGTIFTKKEGHGPDVQWQCAYASRAEYDEDMRIRGTSTAFAEARKAMHQLLTRFERHLFVEEAK